MAWIADDTLAHSYKSAARITYTSLFRKSTNQLKRFNDFENGNLGTGMLPKSGFSCVDALNLTFITFVSPAHRDNNCRAPHTSNTENKDFMLIQ